MPIQSASPSTSGSDAGHEPRAHAQASARSVNHAASRPASSPSGCDSVTTGKCARTSASSPASAGGGSRSASASACDAIAADDRHRGVEAAPDLLLAAPGEEGRRAGVVLAVAAERDQRRLRGRARLLGPPGLHHVEDLDRDVALAEDRRIGQQALRLALEQLADVGPGHRPGRPSPAAPARCGSCRWRASRPADGPRRAARRRGCR